VKTRNCRRFSFTSCSAEVGSTASRLNSAGTFDGLQANDRETSVVAFGDFDRARVIPWQLASNVL
jgi:hypothetical protein